MKKLLLTSFLVIALAALSVSFLSSCGDKCAGFDWEEKNCTDSSGFKYNGGCDPNTGRLPCQ